MIGDFCFVIPHHTPAINTGDETTMFVIWYVSRVPIQTENPAQPPIPPSDYVLTMVITITPPTIYMFLMR
ncbi:hypothetical protein KSZ_24160 [Dictyobacter formicarum]|uniref:Cupin 2 conserved barrel domain-containing protein n=1 Tax=Dictyobacter formicarum TaxID=2778368 RepID=A0ABQ3VE19_9CHLR|nr:hypothetical protein KSZ_24160 [Dictyobacter formicarum]